MFHYEVETEIGNTWENCWRVDTGVHNPNGTPLTFTTAEDAQEEIKGHICDCINAVEGGDMEDSPDPTEFRVVEVNGNERKLLSPHAQVTTINKDIHRLSACRIGVYVRFTYVGLETYIEIDGKARPSDIFTFTWAVKRKDLRMSAYFLNACTLYGLNKEGFVTVEGYRALTDHLRQVIGLIREHKAFVKPSGHVIHPQPFKPQPAKEIRP